MPIKTVPHVHHWRIATATGPTSPGTCRGCGAVREFQNYVEVKTGEFGAYDRDWLSRRGPGHPLAREKD